MTEWNDSEIVLGGVATAQVNQEFGARPVAAFVQESRICTREVELLAEVRTFGRPQLTADHERVLLAEQVALNPAGFKGRVPGISRKPDHPILNADDRVRWISVRLSMSVERVRELLDEASAIALIHAQTDI